MGMSVVAQSFKNKERKVSGVTLSWDWISTVSARVRQCRKDIQKATGSVIVSAVPTSLYNEAELGGKRRLLPGTHHPVWSEG